VNNTCHEAHPNGAAIFLFIIGLKTALFVLNDFVRKCFVRNHIMRNELYTMSLCEKNYAGCNHAVTSINECQLFD
jgi:hypothetical protein